MFRSVLILVFVLVTTSASLAQSVRIVSAETGQGFAFKQDGICWVLMPSHLLDLLGQIEVETSPAPSVLGTGFAYADFWEGMDFAIGTVGQGAGGTACSGTLDQVTQTGVTAGAVLRGDLRFVEEGGAVTQYPMRIVDTIDHKTFIAEFTDPDASSFKGLSGGFLFSGGQPVGMAIQTPDGAARMTFIRIEEIGFATTRWLAGRARAVTERGALGAPAADAPDGGHPLGLASYESPGISPDVGPGNLAVGGAPYIFDFAGPTSLGFSVTEGPAVGVSQVRIVTEGDDAKPLAIRIFTDAGTEDRPNPQRFHSGQMDPTGNFDTGRKGERFARRVLIAIDSVQGSGPVRIDRVEIY